MTTLVTLFLIGLCIGSFLNVCIYRVPRQISLTSPPRSICPSCKTQLEAWENIPLLSWLILLGRCKHCKSPISGQYPLVEILSAIAIVASYLYLGLTPTAFVVYALSATLIVITFIDFEFKIIPNVISFPGMTLGLLLGIVSQFTSLFDSPQNSPITQGAADSLIGFIAGGGVFYVIGEVYYFLTKREGLGGGDIKLMAMTGSILGWRSVAPTIFVGSILGSLIRITIMLLKGGNRQLEIPFGPWLSLGVIVYMFFDLPFFKIP